MSQDSLPPSLQEFRTFLYRHPRLIKEVREEKRTWNQLYQDWVILGEEHEEWKPYRVTEEDKKNDNPQSADSLQQLMKMIGQINVNELQQHIAQFSGVMGNVQRMLQHFQKSSGPPKPPQDPFSFRGF
ncbi:Putative coat protein [Alteribacillus persepolensis]|uniref:Putative coat protein n=1 Tax=Alteribacillus persepolensis TaxID=568899 RepID=A0A1G7YCA0_9BACI|nr:YlbD family protein [Alteribacillus persepolensis]SDG93965.1 Putative coat protein [Alteribacillus persepolensis]